MARIVGDDPAGSEISADDAVHYRVIQDALRKGNAAVMVGSGFSLNAIGGEIFATWSVLAGRMAERLGLDDKEPSPGALQLAEQFEQVFGRTALDELLKQAVPDERASPDKLHRDLLSLPWSEVFTTNYDRLLERAAEELTERPYFTVCCREDIPQSRRLGWTRIVKLHGSFPSNRPFIITEEDYRTYPQTHAPFVNLVRQALLENVLCLIGFSGDDPNFLQWLGWVRDMLDSHSLPVYLFLSKAPSLGERKLLEARGVIPLCLPGIGGYAERYAALIKAFELRPQKADGWGVLPATPRHRDQLDAADQAREITIVYQNLKEALDTYPGWLIAPRANREHFRMQYRFYTGWLGGWPWCQQVISRQSLVFQLCILAAQVRSQQILLEPVDDDQAERVTQLLGGVACLAEDTLQVQLKDERLGQNACADLWQAFRLLACAVLQWARQLMRQDVMTQMKQLLSDSRAVTAEVRGFIAWQDVQLELQQGDKLKAAELLQQWLVVPADDYMLVRKAALMAEVDLQAADQLCTQAVTQLRQKLRDSEDSVAISSHLAWASLVARHMARRNFSESDETIRRAAEPAEVELQKLHAALNAEASRVDRDEWRAGSFDLGFERRTGGTNEAFEAKCRAAFNWLEFAERIGSPPTPEWLQAAWWIQHREAFQRMLGILMRAGGDQSLNPSTGNLLPHQQGWLSRCQLVEIDSTLAASLSQRLLRQLEIAEFRRYSFAAEVVSRLLFRLGQAELADLARRFLQLCIRHPRWADERQSLVLRVFESTPPVMRDELLAMLMAASSDGELLWDWSVERAVPLLRGQMLTESRVKAEGLALACQRNIQGASSPLIAATAGSWRALILLHKLNLLPGAVAEAAAQLLWQPAGEGWPQHQHHHLGPWLAWEPAFRDALNAKHSMARQHLLDSLEQQQHTDLLNVVTSMLEHSHQVVASLDVLEWAPSQFSLLLQGIWRWWDRFLSAVIERIEQEARRDEPSWNSVTDWLDTYPCSLDRMLATQLARSPVSGKSVRGQQAQVEALICLLQGSLPQYFPFWRTRLVLQRGRRGWSAIQGQLANIILLDDGGNDAVGAIQSLRWMPIAQAFGRVVVPAVLLDALLGRLAARYPTTFELDMSCVSEWLAAYPQWFCVRHLSMLDALLQRLLSELDYRRSNRSEQHLPQEALPALRLAAARMAWVLIEQKLLPDSGNAAARWLEAAASDPLPEMRFGRYRIDQ